MPASRSSRPAAGVFATRPPKRPEESQRAPALSVERFVASLQRDPELAGRALCIREQAAHEAETVPLPAGLPDSIRAALVQAGRSALFLHQAAAIEHALAGRNVVISTETSSGKSLAFQVPVLAATVTDPEAHALFIFPTNPLANDQDVSLRHLIEQLPPAARPRGPVRLYGGMGAHKDRIASDDPQILLTNPEMVHLHLLPRHARWASFWRGLKYLVVDEIHLYRGAFGGHVANLLRRVRRCAWRYGARPVVIAASATVGNPRQLAEELCSAPFELVNRSTAPRGRRTTVLWRPPEDSNGNLRSHVDEAVMLFQRSLQAGLQSILFARSRQTVEKMVLQLEERTRQSRVQLGVRAYRAGYLREEREVIENGLRSGAVRGVVTTNALEVGIDIGSLDVCVIAGYPGSVMALRQQSGRVGRRDRGSAIFVVASANPLDTYLTAHPELMLDAEPERAVVGRLNPHILRAHLASAAAEFPLWETEIERFGADVARTAVTELAAGQDARWIAQDARRMFAVSGRPQHDVSLRSASQERWSLVGPEGDVVGELDGAALAREAFPGAVYLHQGRTFRVKSHEPGRVLLARERAGVSTRVEGERELSVKDVLRSRVLLDGVAEVALARIDVIDRYASYLESGTGSRAQARPINPPMVARLTTEGLVLRLLPDAIAQLRGVPGLLIREALHGAEHVVGALCATIVLCDRDDVEGDIIEGPDLAEVVLFDRFPGGIGLAAAAYDLTDTIVARAGETLDGCRCERGCPACVHTNRCLHGNDDVSKAGAQLLLRLLRGVAITAPAPTPRPASRRPPPASVPRPAPPPRRPAPVPERPKRPRRPRVEATSPAEFGVGDMVEHSVYGRGRVLEFRPSGRVVVDFGDVKPRRIVRTWLQKARRE